jgi:hypothetical protein
MRRAARRVNRSGPAFGRATALLALLVLALAGRPGLAAAQEPERVVGEDGQVRYLTPIVPHLHTGWTIGLELGLGDATAFGDGKAYSLSRLTGGNAVIPYSVLFHVGHTVAHDLRLGLVVGGTIANDNDNGMGSTASIGHFDLEATWLPRGDGLFVRGASGLGWLSVYNDSSIQGRDVTCTGLDLSAGVGWFSAPWREAYPQSTFHLMVGLDLAWQRYFDTGAFSGQVKASLNWSLRVGIHMW